MNHYLENDAVISDCGKYRYLLRRTWDHKKPRALLVMLNPSTADGRQDDATIRSCVRLLSGLGYGSMEVVNVFGYRATKPDELLKVDDPCGPKNEDCVKAAIGRCDIVIAAWGAWPPAEAASVYIRNAVSAARPAMFCFGRTQSGAPKHPLCIKSGTPLETYSY
jgi:hypothetical protein